MGTEQTCLISEITNFSTKDGPGIRTSIFVKGCPLRCKWCSNPETFTKERMLFYMANRCVQCGKCTALCPAQAISDAYTSLHRIDRDKCTGCMQCVDMCMHNAFRISGQEFSADALMKVIVRDKCFYGDDGGVTISGGEPLLSGDFVLEIFRRCREEGIGTVLDTTGYGDSRILQEILQYTDLVLLDLKVMDPEKHREWTGVSNERILKNAALIMETVPTRISIPFIGDVNSDAENIKATAAFAAEHGAVHVDLNPLHTLGAGKYHFLGKESPYEGLREPEEEEIQSAVRIFAAYGLPATIGRMM